MRFKIERIKKLIRNEVLLLIANKKLNDPRIPDNLNITKVNISKDLHYCHIYFSKEEPTGNLKLIEKGLNNASGYIQKIIAENINLKNTPRIEFKQDVGEDKANKIDDLLNELIEKRKSPDQL